MKKKLTEIYGLHEGPFDDINKQLAGAKSVAADPRRTQAAGGNDKFADVNKQLAGAKSVAQREAMGGDEVTISFTQNELSTLIKMAQRSDSVPGVREIGNKIRDAMKQGGGGDTPFSSSSSTTRSVGGVKLQ